MTRLRTTVPQEGRLIFRAKRLLPVLALVALAGILWLLNRELRGLSPAAIRAYLDGLEAWRIGAAVALTALGYFVLTGYDELALRYVRHPLTYRKTALASFIAYATSTALGHAVLTGGAVRYRLYSAWGLSGEEIARVVAFCGFAFWMGILALGGIVFVVDPLPAPDGFPVSPRILGVLFLTLFLSWMVVNVVRTRPFTIWKWILDVPGWRITAGQAVVASLDLAIAAAVLWMLLPAGSDLTFARLVSAFLLAVIAGTLSGVPGGLGVFDGALVVLLAPAVPASTSVGALLVYRAVYYLLPFTIAAGALVLTELARHRAVVSGHVDTFGAAAGVWLPRLVPRVLAATTFLAGAVLLVSGALPAVESRMAWLARFVPLEAVEASHFVGSVTGAALLVVARGLWYRRDGAWWIATVLLAIGVFASLARGVDYAEAVALGFALALLLPCHRYFTRRSALLTGPGAPGWTLAVGFVLLSMMWIGWFSYREVPYSSDAWWQFALRADAPRFLRGLAGASAVVLLAGLLRLLRSAPRATGEPPTPAALDRARTIIARNAVPQACLSLLGDKWLLFADVAPGGPDDGFIMYAPQEGSWVAMSGPVGPETTREALAWDFRAAAEAAGARPVLYEVAEDDLPLMLDIGLALYKLGEEARVALPGFSLDGGARRGLRRTARKLTEAGCRFEVIPVEDVPALLPELRRVSAAWLGGKAGEEKGFSLGRFDEDYVRNFPVAVVRAPGAAAADGADASANPDPIVAFSNLWATDRLAGAAPSGGPDSVAPRSELSPDLMRFDREAAPEGVMEYLFIQMMLWGAVEGYTSFSLGMAPLAGLEPESDEARALAPLWNRLGALLFRHGEDFYNFQGLRAYKEKFDPEWSPRYLAVPRGRLPLAAALLDVTTLISGGLSSLLPK